MSEFEFAEDFLPVYDVSDAVAATVDTDREAAWRALLDVDLLRHRLLRQPGGFEGLVKFGASTKHFDPRDPPIADLPRKENRVSQASVTSRHQARNTPHADDLVATIVKAIYLLMGTRQALPLRSSHGGKFVVTSPGARLNGCGGIDVLDLGIRECEHGFDVLAVPSVHKAMNDLDVLLRHRPRSISRMPLRTAAWPGPAQTAPPRLRYLSSTYFTN